MLNAREKYSRTKLIYDSDLRTQFEQNVQAKTPAREAMNSMDQLTDGCVELLPLDNGHVSVEF